jgi:hypothetical protein
LRAQSEQARKGGRQAGERGECKQGKEAGRQERGVSASARMRRGKRVSDRAGGEGGRGAGGGRERREAWAGGPY